MSCNEWHEVSLEEIVDILGDGLHGTPKYDNNGEYYFINGNNLMGKIVVDEKTKKVGEEQYIKYKKELNDRTILVSINGTLGNVAVYNGEKVILGKSACYFNVKKEYNKEFIKYVMLSNIFKNYINTHATGTTIKNIGLKQMRAFKFNIPTIEQQKRISDMLIALDEKIELNNEMNKTLEEMAQALFKRWFVDFEFPNEEGKPYKSSGGEMVESELGMIPKGWSVKNIKEIGEVVAGGTPSTKNAEYYDGNIPWITPKDLSGYNRKFISKGARSITELGLQKSSAKLMKKGTVLFSSRAPIGYIAIADNDVTTNQGFKSIVCDENIINNNYVYHYLCYNKDSIEKVASGSTFKEISGTTMKMLNILVPQLELLTKFKEVLEAYDGRLKLNYKENDSLSELRDSLLSKLMSGEIRVEDIEANL